MVYSDHKAVKKARANIPNFCPKCHKPYTQAGNYKPEDVCQCNKDKNIVTHKYDEGADEEMADQMKP
jgi:hypothetical protein